MKNLGKILLLSIIQSVIILLMPLFMSGSAESVRDAQQNIPTAAADGTSSPAETSADATAYEDGECTIRLITDDGEKELTMQDYLLGVIAAEMPADFQPEALKAQAVAARTYALYKIMSGVHGGAVCSDPTCCQAWLTEEKQREKWGDKYDEYSLKIRQAIEATDGLCAVYDGEPILAAFHSSSCGYTEDSENVFSSALPYLRAVKSEEKTDEVPNYVTVVTLNADELYSAAAAWNSEAAVKVSGDEMLAGAVYTQSGRLKSVKFCGEEISGSEFRQIFSLRSAAISWQREDGGITFTVTGYGHGVGMSQYGAEAMAEDGSTFDEIINHYYTGVEIENMSSVSSVKSLLQI